MDLFAELEIADAESHYLKAIALENLERRDAAQAEMTLALEKAPGNPKYQGYQLRLRLFGGDRKAIEELIELHRQHASSGAVSFFTVFAREANFVQFASQEKVQGAQAQSERANEALKTALALAAEIPEFHRELIHVALSHRMAADAIRLITQLRELEPDNAAFAREQISALLLNQQIDVALKEAESLFRRNARSIEAAQTFSTVLSQSPANADRDRTFEELTRTFPSDVMIVSQYAMYLVRSNRLKQAAEMIDQAIVRQRQQDLRQRLIQLGIALPLEATSVSAAERANLASQRLAQYRAEITEPTLITYYEGRILHLQGKREEALNKMKQVLEAEKSEVGSLRPFGQESLQWIRRIMADGIVNEQLQKTIEAIEAAQKTGEPAPKAEPSDKSDASKPDTPTAQPQPEKPQEPR